MAAQLDGIERADSLEDFSGQRRRRSFIKVEDLALKMRRAGDLGNATVAQFSGATIGVGLKETAKACGMGQAVCRGAVGREAVPGRAVRRCWTLGRWRRKPTAARLRSYRDQGQHRHRCVVGVYLVSPPNFAADAADDRVKKQPVRDRIPLHGVRQRELAISINKHGAQNSLAVRFELFY